jgi:DNA polymerase-4
MLDHDDAWELYQLCRGHDDRPVEPNRVRKSLSNECTFPDNLNTLEECQRALNQLVRELETELRSKAAGREIYKAFVKIKFADFTRTTRESVCPNPNRETYQVLLIEARNRKNQAIRLLGAGVRFVEDAVSPVDTNQRWLEFDDSETTNER